MSKGKRNITRKRFCKLLAASTGLQVQEVLDILRAQEKMHTAQHRKERAE